MAEWYSDWQHQQHVVQFDGRAHLSDTNLARSFEAFNDVRLLNERVERHREGTLVEVGCATGEFHRYLRLGYPKIRYCGFDISEPAITRARGKYPQGHFFLCRPGTPLRESMRECGLSGRPDLLYAKDVVHHQASPFEFMDDLLASAAEALIMRLRTRDVGATELDPERSCQYHYNGWMPYIVMNVQEVIDRIRRALPASELVVYRHHIVLGGRLNRFLPKACYLPDTGTAETAVGVFLTSNAPGRVTIEDRADGNARYTLDYRLRRLAGRVLQGLRRA